MSGLLSGGGGLAALARVSFESTGVGEVISDTNRVERSYTSSLKDMSDAAIKLQIAEDRLRRSVERGPAAWREQGRAELAARRARRELRTETDQLAAATVRQDRAATGLRGRLAGLTGGVASLRGGVGALSVGMLGGAGLTAALVSSLNAASSLEEEISKSRVTFGAASSDVERFASTTSRSIGVARADALAYSSTLGGILNASGLIRGESARLGTQFVQLGGDMASFNNASPVDTLEAIRSGLVGEYEPLRRYQVLLSEARVSQEALRMSGKASKDELTEREKVLARVNLIMRGTVDQQGDAAKTSANYAGQMRRLNAQLRDLQTNAGTTLLPVMTDVVALLNDGTVAANEFARALRRVGSVEIPGTSSQLGSWAQTIFENVGPYSFLTRAGQLRGLLDRGGDDPAERDPIGTRGDRDRPGMGRAVPGPRRPRRRTIADILLDEARAETTAGAGDEIGFKRERRSRIQRQIDSLERRKNLTAKQKAELTQLYGELASVESEIDTIIDAGEQKIADERARRADERARKLEEAARKREESERKAAERMKRIDEAAARASERRGDLLAGTGGSRQNMRKQALKNVDEVVKGLKGKGAESKGLTEAEVRSLIFGSMSSMQGTMNQFAGNLHAPGSLQVAGAPNPELFSMVTLMREQNYILTGLASGLRHPGTKYARTEIAHAFDGPTF